MCLGVLQTRLPYTVRAGEVRKLCELSTNVPWYCYYFTTAVWAGKYAILWNIHVIHKLIIMPRCACASEVYGSVFVCVCVSVCLSVCLCRLLQLLKDQRSASKGFYRLLVMFSWILIRGFKIMLRSRVMARFVYLECHCSLFRTVRSKTCPCSVATLLSS